MTFTDEQEALRAAVRKLLAREVDPRPALCCQIGIAALGHPGEVRRPRGGTA